MPKVSKESATNVEVMEGILEDRSEELDGYMASFTTFLSDMDDESLFKGLPDDRCQCPHWGYMLKGKVTFRFADREETYEAGDAFYVPPGHIPVFYAGGEFIDFSPADELAETMEVVMGNLAASEQS
jgi:hypothetical protein